MGNKPDQYLTIKEPSISEFKEKGSKFIGYLFPVRKIIEFEGYIEELRKEHFKANHHCFAYRLNYENELYRFSDDGEPSGTAGKPIYGQIIKNNLYDVACISIRYFGGTKLGTSGLITSYRASCAMAIDNAQIIEKTLSHIIQLKFDYSIMGNLMSALKQLDIPIIHKQLEESGSLKIEIPKSLSQGKINLLKAKLLGVSLEQIEEKTSIAGLRIIFPD